MLSSQLSSLDFFIFFLEHEPIFVVYAQFFSLWKLANVVHVSKEFL